MTTFLSRSENAPAVGILAGGSGPPFDSSQMMVHSMTALPLADAAHHARTDTVLIYEDLSAALWAAETIIGLTRDIPSGLKPHLSSWSFAALENPASGALVTSAAVRAKLIVISTCGKLPILPAAVERWLANCLADRRSVIVAVAALFGREDSPDNLSYSPRLQTVQRLAKEARCDFFAPSVTDGVFSTASN